MGTIWVKEFSGGLDTRRLPETASGAILIKGDDVHLSRGAEIEKRAAFVSTYTLPAGTVGLAHDRNGIVVFGHTVQPANIPAGVTYQRLQHPSGVALSRVPSYDLYAGKIYAVGEFADGSVYHFYDGVRVTDLNDGRARASFTVTNGAITPATQAVGSFEILSGTSGVGHQIDSIKIDGVSIIGGAVSFATTTAQTAAAAAAAINAYTSNPDYTATSSGQTVTVTANFTGSSVNGKSIVITFSGQVSVGNIQPMSGGSVATASTLSALTVDGVSIIGLPVAWSVSNSNMAASIATAVNSYTSNPDYTATAVANQVNIVAGTAGTATNGKVLAFTTSNGLTLTPSSDIVFAGGTADTLVAGSFVKTIGSRMHAVSSSLEYGSGLGQPTKWTTDAVGAYFIDMSTQSSGSEILYAVNQYQSYVAVFAERAVQIWKIDSDPFGNQQVQTLINTGTVAARSVTQFGDADLFYLDSSGIRSLKARDSSNAASTADIGVPIDTLVIDKLKNLTAEDRTKIIGLIEPTDGRFWLIMKDEIFVFSYFSGVKISAWSRYLPRFTIDSAVVFNKKIYLRSNNTIYVYGGLESNLVYDNTPAEAWLPYLDAGTPSKEKTYNSLDVAARGLWQVSISYDPLQENVYDDAVKIWQSTFGRQRIPITGKATHIGLRFRTVGSEAAKIGSVLVHFESDANED